MDVPQQPPAGEKPGQPAGPVLRRPLNELPPLTPVSSDPVISVPAAVLARYNARVLDPSTAVRVAGEPAIRPTVFLADKLLVSGQAAFDTRDALTKAAEDNHLLIKPPLVRDRHAATLADAARAAGRSDADAVFPQLHELLPTPGAAVVADAWQVLQTFRAKLAALQSDHPGQQHVGLDHLLTATKHIMPGPFDPPENSVTGAVASYGSAGWGGRQPVNLVGVPPHRNDKPANRRPVVAVLDTGTGAHDWFPWSPETVVHRNQTFNGAMIGLGEPSLTEQTGVVEHELEGVLDPYSGHGTFIAGLIHQQCPDADILSIRIMPSEGAVPEHALLEALKLLACRQQAAQENGIAADIIDVVSLSLGYYHEQVGDDALDPLLWEPIQALGRCGVVVVASAGNDATTRPMYPAAFTPYPNGFNSVPDPGCVPVLSVGAANPDGSIALFSNAGPWVTCVEPGAAVVSTFPKFDAAAQAAYGFHGVDGWRSTIDPDNFHSGFGVWSGTSFAAPILAGKIAKALADGTCGSTTDAIRQPEMLERGWSAVSGLHLVAQP
jgi:Subtilase family